jgi:hypothetical protein
MKFFLAFLILSMLLTTSQTPQYDLLIRNGRVVRSLLCSTQAK